MVYHVMFVTSLHYLMSNRGKYIYPFMNLTLFLVKKYEPQFLLFEIEKYTEYGDDIHPLSQCNRTLETCHFATAVTHPTMNVTQPSPPLTLTSFSLQQS